jgi:hypothetical protein
MTIEITLAQQLSITASGPRDMARSDRDAADADDAIVRSRAGTL